MKNFIIVGSGRQGLAVAYDLLRDSNHYVTMIDINQKFLDRGLDKLSKISSIKNLTCVKADVTKYDQMYDLLKNIDVMISAVPYEFNLELTKLLIK